MVMQQWGAHTIQWSKHAITRFKAWIRLKYVICGAGQFFKPEAGFTPVPRHFQVLHVIPACSHEHLQSLHTAQCHSGF